MIFSQAHVLYVTDTEASAQFLFSGKNKTKQNKQNPKNKKEQREGLHLTCQIFLFSLSKALFKPHHTCPILQGIGNMYLPFTQEDPI